MLFINSGFLELESWIFVYQCLAQILNTTVMLVRSWIHSTIIMTSAMSHTDTVAAEVGHLSWLFFLLSTGVGRNYSSSNYQGSYCRAGTSMGNNFLFWLEGLCLCPLHRRAREEGYSGPNELLFECRLCLFLTCYPKLLVWDFSPLKIETNRHNFVGRAVKLKEMECVLVPESPVL